MMDLCIVSTVGFIEQLEQEEKLKIESTQCVFVTRDWFVLQSVKDRDIKCELLDVHLNKDENKTLMLDNIKLSNTWYLDSKGDDFSLYKNISLGDIAIQQVANGIFSHLLSFTSNVIKLIEKYKPKLITYEYNDIYRSSYYFSNEDIILQQVCKKFSIKFECIYSHKLSEIDKRRYKESPVLQMNKNYFGNLITEGYCKGKTREAFNLFNVYKFNLFNLSAKGKKCILTDNNRGLQDFYERYKKEYLFFQLGITTNLINLMQNNYISLLSNNHKKYAGQLELIQKNWKILLSKEPEKFYFYGIDFTWYVSAEIGWIIKNLFPKLMELIDKIVRYISKVDFDAVFCQADSVIAYRFIYNVAKHYKIKNFFHADGPRDIPEIGGRFADHILLYSQQCVKNYENEKVKSKLYLVGNPPFQKLYEKRCVHVDELTRRPITILVAAKNDGQQLIGNSWSSGNEYLRGILEGIEPLKEHFKIVIRSNVGQSNYLSLLKEKYFLQYLFEIQNAREINFETALQNCDILIGKASTTIFEAAILNKIVIYFCNNQEWHYAPFDFNSELVSAKTSEELTNLLAQVISNDFEKITEFNQKHVLEKYCGPLVKPHSEELMNNILINQLEG